MQATILPVNPPRAARDASILPVNPPGRRQRATILPVNPPGPRQRIAGVPVDFLVRELQIDDAIRARKPAYAAACVPNEAAVRQTLRRLGYEVARLPDDGSWRSGFVPPPAAKCRVKILPAILPV